MANYAYEILIVSCCLHLGLYAGLSFGSAMCSATVRFKYNYCLGCFVQCVQFGRCVCVCVCVCVVVALWVAALVQDDPCQGR